MPQKQTKASDWASLIIENIEETLFSVDTNWRFTYLNHRATAVFGQATKSLLGKVLWEAFPSLVGSAFEPVYRQVMATGTPQRVEDFSFTTQSWYDVRAYPIPQGLIISFQDINARKLAEAEVQFQSARARVQAEVSRTLAEVTHDYQETLTTATRQLTEIIGATCIIRLISPDGQWFELAASQHSDSEAAAFVRDVLVGNQEQPVSVGLAGRVVQTGQSVLIPVISSEQLRAITEPKHWADLERFTSSSVLIAPLHANGHVLGIIALTRPTSGRPYTEDDQTLLQDLAGRVAIAIVNARLLRQVQAELAERVRTEAALRLSEERFKVLSETAYEALVLHGNGIIVEANHRAAELSGYELDELIGMPIAQLIAPELRTTVLERLATTRAYEGESIAVRKDGTRFLIESRGKIIDYRGNPVWLVGVRDITERKRTEQDRAFLAAIVASSEDAIIGKTLEGIILSWNRGAENLYGYTAEEVIGRPINLLVPADRPDEVSTILDKIRRGEHIMHYETRRVSKNGSVVDVALTISPIRDTTGSIIGASTIAQNVTERKRLEAQLLQSQKMESVGRLAGGIAHDFNNLLTAIISYADLMAFDLDKTKQYYRDALEIQKAGHRAAALTRQLLAFSRQQMFESQLLNVNGIVSDMAKLLHRLLGEDIEQVTVLEPDLAPVLADPSQIEQVIMNLAINARDAMPNGGQLTIETANVMLDEQYRVAGHFEVKTGAYVMLAMSDTGIGMDQATQERIFEPFFTTKEFGKGTGLGLSTVYGIVKQSEGAIWVYSELGIGTTFKIYLPRGTMLSLAQLPEPTPMHQPASKIARQNFTILVVEDEAVVRELIHRVLKQAGYITLDAQNGHQALDLVAAHPDQIDLIITDIIMPRMTGWELVDQLHQQGAQIKVIYMSGYTNQTVKQHMILQQRATYLQKPFTPEILLRQIDDMLRNAV